MKIIPTNLFDFTTVKTPALQGSLLVAEPFLRESYFLHSVISLIDRSDTEGTMGVVLNNCTNLKLHNLLSEIDRSHNKVPVFCGGPLSQDRLFFMHTLGPDIVPDSQEIYPGMWLGSNLDVATEYINSGYPVDGVLRFFLGYSGWSVGQLENELENNVWAVANDVDVTSAELLSTNGDRTWHRVVRAMGAPYRTWQLHPALPNVN
jgi:putative transcriptional regulator